MWWQFGPLPCYAADDGTGSAVSSDASDAGDGSGDGSSASLLDRGQASSTTGDSDSDSDGDGEAAGDGDGGDHRADRRDGDAGDGDGDGEKATTVDKLVFKDRPEWLPKDFWTKDSGEVDVEGLASKWKYYRDMVSKGLDKVPEKPADYTFEAPEDLKHMEEIWESRLEDGQEDPVIEWARQAFHENGINQATGQKLYEGFLRTVEKIIPQLPDPDAELKKLGNNGQTIVDAMATFRQTLLDSGTFNEAEAQRMTGWMLTAADIQAFQKIREWYGEKAIPYNAQTTEGVKSAGELQTALRGVLEKANKGDAGAQKEYEALMIDYEKLYGTDAAGSSTVAA